PERASDRADRPRLRELRALRYPVPGAASLAVRFPGQSLDSWIQRRRRGAFRAEDEAVQDVASPHQSARYRNTVRAERRSAERHRLDLRHQLGHAHSLRPEARDVHDLSATHASDVHARDRFRCRGWCVDFELEYARMAHRDRAPTD